MTFKIFPKLLNKITSLCGKNKGQKILIYWSFNYIYCYIFKMVKKKKGGGEKKNARRERRHLYNIKNCHQSACL